MVVINATVPPPDEKAIITEGATGANVTISGFELTGAAVSADDGNNGAGIRYQGGNLTLTDDYIHANQEGILAGTPPVAGTGTISISNSEFADNGDGSGYTHNIYVNNIALLEITNSLITGAVVGHEIKSRALDTVITDNVIADGPTGTASYSIDLPNGGDATITGNVIEKGPDSENPSFIAYGEESVTNRAPASPSRTTPSSTTSPVPAAAVWNDQHDRHQLQRQRGVRAGLGPADQRPRDRQRHHLPDHRAGGELHAAVVGRDRQRQRPGCIGWRHRERHRGERWRGSVCLRHGHGHRPEWWRRACLCRRPNDQHHGDRQRRRGDCVGWRPGHRHRGEQWRQRVCLWHRQRHHRE